MKKLLVLTLISILAFTFVSCQKKDDTIPDGMFYEQNDAVSYKLYLPEGWIVDRNDKMVSAHASEDDRSNVSVTAFSLPRQFIGNLDEYIKSEYRDYLAKNLSGIEFLVDFEVSTLGTLDARRAEFLANVGGIDYRFMQLLTQGPDGYVYIFTYTSTPDAFDSHSEEIQMILDNFKLY